MKTQAKALLLLLLLLTLTTVASNELIPQEEWSIKVFDIKPRFYVPRPVFHAGKILTVGGRGDLLVSFSIDGEKLWSVNAKSKISSSPIIVPGERGKPWAVVVTDTSELKAFDANTGNLKVDRVKLPSKPSGADLSYLRTEGVILIPTISGKILALNLRSKSVKWEIDVGFNPRFVKYLEGKVLAVGYKAIALVDLSSKSVVWTKEFSERIVAYGADGRYIGVLLENQSIVSFELNGDFNGIVDGSLLGLGGSSPPGEFPVINGVAVMTSTSQKISFVNLSDLSSEGIIKTWVLPVKQPSLIGEGLLYFTQNKTIRAYHLSKMFKLGEFGVNHTPYSEVTTLMVPDSPISYACYIDRLGDLVVLSLPSYWIKIQSIEEKPDGYYVEGFICRTDRSGGPVAPLIYGVSLAGEELFEKKLSIVSAGSCGARFTLTLPEKGAIGLIVEGQKLPPSVPIGLTREEWLSSKGGITTTPPTTTYPVVRYPEILVPQKVVVGEEFNVKISGTNIWNVSKLIIGLKGEGISEVEKSIAVQPEGHFEATLESIALHPSNVITLTIRSDGEILNKTDLSLSIVSGRIIEEVSVPSIAKVGQPLRVKVGIVNRFSDGESFRVKVFIGGSSKEVTIGPLKAGEKGTSELEIEPQSPAEEVRVEVFTTTGQSIDKKAIPIKVTPPTTTGIETTSPPVQTTTTPSGLPIPMEYLLVLTIALAIIGVGLLLAMRKPREVERARPEKLKERPVPKVERELPEIEKAVRKPPEEEIPTVEEIKPEIKPTPEAVKPPEPEEEVPEIPKVVKEEVREEPVEKIEEIIPPMKIPTVKKEEIETRLGAARERLDRIKRRMRELEEIVGFELSPYRLTDAESTLITAELKMKEGNFDESDRLLSNVEESLDILETEIKEAKDSLVENWGAIDNRIEIMLKVWGRAPANMLTMVPAGFRIAALERYRRLHPEKNLELRGDELVLIEGQ